MDPLLRLTLRQGTVYYMVHRDLFSAEPHYFIVINRDPFADKALLMAVSSSRVEKVVRRTQRRELPDETVVRISTSEYSEFSKESCIDCNTLFSRSLTELSELRKQGGVVSKADLPVDVLERIIEGVLASPLVSETDKALIRRPDRRE